MKALSIIYENPYSSRYLERSLSVGMDSVVWAQLGRPAAMASAISSPGGNQTAKIWKMKAADPRLDRILMALLKPQGFQVQKTFFRSRRYEAVVPKSFFPSAKRALLTKIMDDGWITQIEYIPNKSGSSTAQRSLNTALIHV